jgi:hypothetical protein
MAVVGISDEWLSVAQTTDEAYDNEHDAYFSELEAACAISLVSPIPLTLPENS